MEKIVVNHVMSDSVRSGIFDSIIEYFKSLSSPGFRHITSVKPIAEADVWHYHRPHLESSLKHTSIVTVHHDLRDTDKWVSYEKFASRYKEAKKIVCLNNSQRDFLKDRGFSEISVIPHGYNEKIFSAVNRVFEKDKFTFLIASKRYGRRVKGESYLMDLLQWLDNKKVGFLLVGDGRGFDKLYMSKFGFDSKFYERLPYPLYGDLYRQADFLLMSSYFEGGPASIPEAISSSMPVICNPIGMARDFVVSDYNGLWLNMSPKLDAELINNKLHDKVWLNNVFSNAASKDVTGAAITWSDVVRKYCDVYSEVVS